MTALTADQKERIRKIVEELRRFAEGLGLLIEDILNESDEPEVPSWQPIATAPKDGNDVIGYAQGLTRIVFWDEPRGGIWSSWPGRAAIHPTHWQPLPAPPDQKAQQERHEFQECPGTFTLGPTTAHYVECAQKGSVPASLTKTDCHRPGCGLLASAPVHERGRG